MQIKQSIIHTPCDDVEHPEIVSGPILIDVTEPTTGLEIGKSHVYFTGMAGLDVIERLIAGMTIAITYPQSKDE